MKLKNYLNESSLSRVQKTYSEHDTGIMTATRSFHECGLGDKITRKENQGRNSILVTKLIKRGYGVTKLKGVWLEEKERSYFITDLKDSGKLKGDMIELGEQFEQDAILFSKKNDNYYAISTNKCGQWPGNGKIGIKEKIGKPKFSKKGAESYSLIGGRPFIFEHYIRTIYNYHPTEIRSIMHIDKSYPNKKSIRGIE